MLSHPRDISLSEREVRAERTSNIATMLSTLLGDSYVHEMKPSPLPKRLSRMKGEIDAHEEEFERKLRYLFWLN